jgi:hypothetical protein
MRTQSADTPAEIEAVVLERYRTMGAAARLDAAFAMNRAVATLAAAGVRLRHGADLGDHELRLRLFALRLDAETMRRAFDWDPEIEGY